MVDHYIASSQNGAAKAGCQLDSACMANMSISIVKLVNQITN